MNAFMDPLGSRMPITSKGWPRISIVRPIIEAGFWLKICGTDAPSTA
jgi:hypothetical protein